jgi:hypothetical protein
VLSVVFSDASLMSAPVSALGATLTLLTAFFFSCFVPTDFAASWVAAYEVPPSAMKIAISP